MSEYYFRTDTNRTHKITTIPFSINNLKFFCGSNDKEVQFTTVLQGSGNDGTSDSSINADNNPLSPYSYNSVQDSNINKRITVNDTQKKDVYYRTVFLVCKDTTKGISHNYSVTQNLSQYFEIVTNIQKANECKLLGNYNNAPTCTLCYDGNTTGGYTGGSELLKNADNTNNNYRVFAYHVYIKSSKTFIFRSSFHSTVRFPVGMPVLMYYRPNSLYLKTSAEKTLSFDSVGDTTTNNFVLYQYPLYDTSYKTFYEIDNNIGSAGHTVYTSIVSGRPLKYNNYTGSSSTGTDISCWFSPNEIDLCFEYARYGMYFVYNGTCYKPIIEGGIVTGYTTDYTRTSDIDEWVSFNHTVPEPESDKPSADKLDDIGLNLNANGNSFIHYYACTQENLEALLAWCNSQTQFNAIDWIIGVKQAPCNIPSISSCSPAEIYLKGIGTEVNAYSIGNQGSSSTTDIQSYAITRLHNNFLDYEPYTHIDLYVPYCGSVSLPPSLFMGRTLKTEMIYDIFSGECSCAIFADNTYYTSIGGVFMTQQAVSAEQMGSIHNAVVNGAMSIIGGGISTVAGAVAGNPLMAVGGAVSMVGGAVKSYQTINSISPEVRGNSGGRCNFYKPDSYILMITTPNNSTDSNFKKVNGLMCCKSCDLTRGMGMTVIDRPIINGDMTQTERQEIESYMKSGVIL